MSVGSVQAIEYNKWEVGIAKIERYAAVFGTTADRLLHPEVLRPVDPQWQDLNEDHLMIARRYMKARTIVRTAVEVLLAEDAGAVVVPIDGGARSRLAKLAELVLAIKEAADRDLDTLWAINLLLDERALMVEIAHCVDADPDAVRELLDKMK
jgi:hypothetical protein